MRIRALAIAATTAVAMPLAIGPAKAGWFDNVLPQSWDDFLNEQIESGREKFNQLRESAERRISSTTITLCMASDKTAWLTDERVEAAFEQSTGHEVNYVLDGSKFPGSLAVMDMAQRGECDAVSPDASVIALLPEYSDFDPQGDNAFPIATSFVVGFMDPLLAEEYAAHLSEERGGPVAIDDLTFVDMVHLADREWSDVSAQDYGPVAVYATDTDKSASGTVVGAILPYAYTAQADIEIDSRRLANDADFAQLMTTYFDAVNHSYGSTSRLTEAARTSPANFPVFWSYESKIQEVVDDWEDTDIGTPVIVRGNAAAKADHVVWNLADDPDKQAVVASYISFLRSPDVQRLAAEEYNFRPAIPLKDLSGPISEYKGVRQRNVSPRRDIVAIAYSYK